MAENLLINGVTYNGVDSLAFKNSNGETVYYSLDNAFLPSYWIDYLPNKIATIKALQDEAGNDGFSFIVMSDIHYPENLGKRSPAIAKHIMDECNIRYALVLGDIQSRGSHATKAQAESDFTGAEKMFEPIAGNVLFQKGNHDGSWGSTLNGTTYPYNFTPEEMYNRIYAPVYKHHNVVTDKSGTGYYVNDTANKVRYIMLCTHCNEYAENDDGSAKYNNMSYARFTQSQYDLVIEALSTMPEGWAVLCAAHVPINNTYGEAFGDSTNKTGDHIIMRNLLKAYKDKTAYSAEWAGTAGGGTNGGYTNIFSTSGSGFDNQTSKFYTNWLPYNGNDNGGTGTIYHFKGISAGQPYKMNFATDANGANATSQFYCTAANKQAPTAADYDSGVIIVQHHTPEYKYVRFEIRQALPENLIITANEPIIEATGGGEGYDTVSINADFSSAKGEMIGYFSGHTHADYVYDAANWWGVSIITTRCDSANENDSTLLAQRVEGTVTEQSFDVFTVNRKTGKVYATKIGAGSDREISY